MTTRDRIKGKIAACEWPTILQRHEAGEPIATIARSYQCTPPAIRYILRRGRPPAASAPQAPPPREDVLRKPAFSRTLIERVNGDVAAFLVAFDTLCTAFNARNAKELHQAADRLLQCSAHTRIELDRLSRLLPAQETGQSAKESLN